MGQIGNIVQLIKKFLKEENLLKRTRSYQHCKMSDTPPFNSFLKWKLGIESPSLAYAAKTVTKSIIFAVDVPYPLLKAWNEFIKTKKNDGNITCDNGEPSCSTPSNLHVCEDNIKISYVDLFEFSIPGGAFAISSDQEIRLEVNESLRKLCGKVKSEYAKAKGTRRKEELNSKLRRFHIFEGQTESVKELRRENDLMKDEIAEWRKSYSNLQEEMKKLYSEMCQAIEEKDTKIDELEQKNEELLKYIACLEKSESLLNKGKDIADIKKKSRTLKTFLSRANTALWFSKSFGLDIQEIIVKEQKTGQSHTLEMDKENSKTKGGIDYLTDTEKAKIEQVLFLLDKFCVGDAFYHEMTMIADGLPKSYLVKQRRDQLNDICHISPTPGDLEGAQMSFTGLLKERAADMISREEGKNWAEEPIQVKISGDGARMTRNSSFILLSFSLLQAGDDVMSAGGNHTIAIVKGSECYNTLRESFGTVFNEINELIQDKQPITINNTSYNLEFFLGGDYKFLLLMLGMKGATSIYACLWCKIAKTERWNMKFDLEYYNKSPLQRTLQEVLRMARQKGNQDKYSCEHEPLLKIELDHVVLDELHLLLRIMDVLINNLVKETVEWDKKENFNKRKADQKNIHVKNLQSTIRSCGISFDIWEKTNADGKGSGLYDFTSLLGADKKKLLTELPPKLSQCIHPETSQTVTKIWKDFHELYQIITNKDSSSQVYLSCFIKAKAWVNLFTSLRDKLSGYRRADVTPYMHALVYHVPLFIKKYKSVKSFTGQGVERNNDMARNVVLHKSNKRNPAADVLRLESRQWQLRERERSKRTYSKTNSAYWETEIRAKRKKQQ